MRVRRLAGFAFALALCAPFASAEIFKCTDPNGVLRLQNFACSLDSIGSSATASPTIEKRNAPTSTGTRTLPFIKIEPPSPAPTAHTVRAIIRNGEEPNGEEPYAGMPMKDVREQWGEPKGIRHVNGAEMWLYDGPHDSTRGVRFDRDGKVVAISDEDS